uniref:Uncharacterized protein n=1 Tax=Panagrolaimus sp. PS1159 TaxID=55785 RepID=A0AC35F4S1_9BILA
MQFKASQLLSDSNQPSTTHSYVTPDCQEILDQLTLLIGFSIGLNLLLSIGIIGLNLYLIYHFVWKQTVKSNIVAAGVSFSQAIQSAEFARIPPIAIQSAEFARIPPIGIAVIAEMGGLSLNDVVSAYDKDSMERRAIVYSIMGRTAIAKKFVDQYRSIFMSKGYEGEETVLATTAK